jgi:four helix bundle protein
MATIKSFTDLNVWKEAHSLVLAVYQETRQFPQEELYGLTNQIRRCAVSITSNLAEGFSRQSHKEKLHFYFTAKGSLTELQNQLLIARDVRYLNKSRFQQLANLTVTVGKLLTGFIKATKQKK